MCALEVGRSLQIIEVEEVEGFEGFDAVGYFEWLDAGAVGGFGGFGGFGRSSGAPEARSIAYETASNQCIMGRSHGVYQCLDTRSLERK